jgi:hypothetical protein
MKAPSYLLGSIVVVLVACDDKALPPGQTSRDGAVTPLDVPAIDAPAGDVADVAAPPSDADDASVDAPADAPADATADVVVDAGPADAPPVTRGLCAWNHSDLAAFAVRFSQCTFRPPQEALNTYFNPSNWEGGPLAVRACPALRCVADTSSPGTCGAWLSSCLKYEVARVDGDGGACPTPAGSCDGATPTTARTCAAGVETRDNCVALGLRCVSSGGEAACVSPLGNACAPGAPARCNGNVLEQCVLGVYTRARDCDLTAGVCDATAGTCRGAGPECTGAEAQCDGTSLRVCRGGRWHALDCGRLVTGAACQTVNGHAFCGVARDCDPTVAAATGACDGNTLVLCAAGRTYRYTCEVRNGFSRCEAGRGCVN